MTNNVTATALPMVSTFASDPDMQPLVQMFVEEAPDKMEVLGTAMTQANLEAAKQFAHQLKGSAAGYGFPALTEAAGHLERLLSQPQPDEQLIAQSANTVLDMLQRLRAE